MPLPHSTLTQEAPYTPLSDTGSRQQAAGHRLTPNPIPTGLGAEGCLGLGLGAMGLWLLGLGLGAWGLGLLSLGLGAWGWWAWAWGFGLWAAGPGAWGLGPLGWGLRAGV